MSRLLETQPGFLRCCGRTLILRRRVQAEVPGHGAAGNHSISRAWFAIHRVSSQASGTGPLDNLQPDQKLDGQSNRKPPTPTLSFIMPAKRDAAEPWFAVLESHAGL